MDSCKCRSVGIGPWCPVGHKAGEGSCREGGINGVQQVEKWRATQMAVEHAEDPPVVVHQHGIRVHGGNKSVITSGIRVLEWGCSSPTGANFPAPI